MQLDCSRCPLRQNNIFAPLTPEQSRRLDAARRTVAVAPGEVLCHEGAEVWGVACIAAGAVKLTRSGDRGEDQVIRLLGPGSIFGLRPLFAGDDYSVRATAVEDGKLCLVSRATIFELLRESPEFVLAVLSHLAHELRYSENMLMALTQRAVPRRVADVLLLLDGRTVRGDDWEPLPHVRLKRREIAQMVGTTPETLSRVLADFAARGLIRTNRRAIHLVDIEGLQAVARERKT